MKTRLPFALDWTVFLTILALPVIHFCVSKVALSLAFKNGVTVVWPTAGIYLAAVLVLGYRIWPAILFSELLINSSLIYQNIVVSVSISIIDLLDPLLVTFGIHYFIRHYYFLNRSQDVFKFVGVIMASPLLTTTLATTVLCLNGIASWKEYGESWWSWWTSIVISMLLVTPALLTWSKRSRLLRQPRRLWIIEFTLLLFLTAVITQVAFGGEYSVEYMLIPLLAWSAFRFQHREVTLLIVIMSGIAIWGTAQGFGSFVRPSANESLVLLQSFVGVIALSTLLLSAVIHENRQAALELQQANEELEQRVDERTLELKNALQELQQTQFQMIQSEKMSSLGQLVAGVAHEINNPVNFIHGNISHLNEYTQDLLRMLQLYQQRHLSNDPEIQALAEEIDLEFLISDLQKMLASMKMGTDRIRSIVLSLRNFSRMDEAEFKAVDIHEGIESTLLILQHRLKDKPECPAIEVTRDYGSLPQVECYPGQLNQVLMNILVNAIDALDEVNAKRTYQQIEENPSQITIRTAVKDVQWIEIAVADNGPGMTQQVKNRIFDPFFTTKPVGKGTGMGMAISYQIITEKHGGKLECLSTLGKGTEFIIQLPIRPLLCNTLARSRDRTF
ncbi:MASE1 domain-containing protein [Scytonema hofmannii]|nr:MASE1 domain-containing protein [Scytonema hofmannii]